MKKYTVFYAWQSDIEQNYNRHLIRKALDMAAEAISTDLSVAAQVIIDSDTQGVDGRVAMTVVTLKPHIVFGGEKRPSARDIDAIHLRAHDACFIANSVKSEVRVEGSAEGLRE